MSKAKLMLGNAVEISLIFRRILGPLVLGWAPNHFVLEAQLAPGDKRLVSIPGNILIKFTQNHLDLQLGWILPAFSYPWKQSESHLK